MKSKLQTIQKELLAGNRRALAQAISIVEDGGADATALVKALYPYSGKAHLIGITGPPGVGKSTLIDKLIMNIRHDGLAVAVLAIDPSSPFSGGAILGDRVRMQAHTLDKNVFIRSMANHGQPGGVALSTNDAIHMLEASGFDVILIETVGVGQSELAIAQTADTTILVVMPGTGDDIQAIKSGIMEIADIFVVNKGDLPQANKTASEIINRVELSEPKDGWRTPVIITKAESSENIDELWSALEQHYKFLKESGLLLKRRKAKVLWELTELVAARARENLKQSFDTSKEANHLLTQIVTKEIDPHSASEKLICDLFG